MFGSSFEIFRLNVDRLKVYDQIYVMDDYIDIDRDDYIKYPKLVGDIYALSIFACTHEDEWEEKQKRKALKSQDWAERWIRRQARKYDVDLSFTNEVIGYEEPFIKRKLYEARESDKGDYYIVYSILKEVGYKNITTFDYNCWKEHDCDESHVIVYGIDEETSFATQRRACFVYGEKTRKSEREDYLENHRISGYTIAHEVLHLYGAEDLYYDKSRKNKKVSRRRARAGRERYAQDIMAHDDFSFFRRPEISNFTAWCLGWHEWPRESYLKLLDD